MPWLRCTRRDVARLGALLVVGHGRLRVDPAARTRIQNPKIVLVLDDQFTGLGVSVTSQLVQETLERYFYPTQRGVEVRVGGVPFFGQADGGVAAILAGTGPDLLSGCCTDLPTLVSAGVLRPLDDLLRRDNIPLSLFSPGHVAALTTTEGLMGLPSYDGPQVLFVNETLLDTLGLSYPQPDWTYEDAVRLWEAASGADHRVPGGWRYGAALNWYVGGWGGYWLPFGWGGSWIDATGTRALFDSSACLAAYTWVADLFRRRVAIPRSGAWSLGMGSVAFAGAGGAAMAMAGGWTLVEAIQAGKGIRWNYYPMPRFPAGPTTMINVDFWGLSAYSKHPEAAWELFKFVTTSKQMQELNIRTNLVGPALVSMWPFWEEFVQQIAPPLRGKNLHLYGEAVQYAHGHVYFKYEPVEANNLIAQATTKLPPAGNADVATTLRELTRQIDALEQIGAEQAAAVARAEAAIGRALQGSGPLPAPPRTGIGRPPTPLPAGWFSVGSGGRVTLTGGGADVWTPSANASFAGAGVTARAGSFTCRVVALENVDCPYLSQWAKVGLLVAGDLSDAAAALTLEVTGANGVYQQVQPVPGNGWSATGPSSPTAASGLIGATALTYPNHRPAANYLRRPLWLRWVRDGLSWTGFTSWDGVSWTPTGPAVALEAAGCWVGLFVCAHNISFGGKGLIRAVFDHVSFPLAEEVQIGTA
jgi:ABC-type glycerol-3-phosphate transport system substrate-binding protein